MRTLVVWCPDWPVMSVLSELPDGAAAAVFQAGKVLACSPGARAEGIRRGMRRRDAQSRCPDLVVAEHRPLVDASSFEELLCAIEQITPAVSTPRPGLCMLRVPSRFYGGEQEAVAVIAERLVELGVWDVRLGVADTVFAAEQAARRAQVQDCVVVPEGAAAQFLDGLAVEVLPDAELAGLLRRLGLRTLGDFARLSAADVLTRFGSHGALLHRLASGFEPKPWGRRSVPADFSVQVLFEPPLASAEPIAFSVRTTTQRFVSDLAEVGLVCTGVRIEADVDGRVASARSWLHPRWFTAADLVDRVRWQLEPGGGSGLWAEEGSGGGSGLWAEELNTAVDAVRFIPEVTESLAEHAEPLFGTGLDERVERAVARVQAMVGHEGVVAAQIQGGRSPRSRTLLAPWGERLTSLQRVDAPWPGSIPPPPPATVFAVPLAAVVLDHQGRTVGVDARGGMHANPVQFRPSSQQRWQPVVSWAGPWPVDEHWWDEAAAHRRARFQLVGADAMAWLMFVEAGQWWTEARYD